VKKWVEKWVGRKRKTLENAVFSRVLTGDSSGIRTTRLILKMYIMHIKISKKRV